jgi:hypothetical protein
MLALILIIVALVCFLLSGFGVSYPPLNWDGLGKAALVGAYLAGASL